MRPLCIVTRLNFGSAEASTNHPFVDFFQDVGDVIRQVVNRYLHTKNNVPATSDLPTSATSPSQTPPPQVADDSKTPGIEGKVSQGLVLTPVDTVVNGMPWVTLEVIEPKKEFSLRILFNERVSLLHEVTDKDEQAVEDMWKAVEELLLDTTNLKDMASRRFYLEYLRLLVVHAESTLPITNDVLQVPVHRVIEKLAHTLTSTRLLSPADQRLGSAKENQYFIGLELRYVRHDPAPPQTVKEREDAGKTKNDSSDSQEEALIRGIYDGEGGETEKEGRRKEKDEL